jgi:hypothetical protein
MRATILHAPVPLEDDVPPPVWTDHLPEGWIAVKHPYIGSTARLGGGPEEDRDYYALFA